METTVTTYDARTTLDRMEQIVLREQVLRGAYVHEDINKKLQKEEAICGGHKACAVGALWIAHGIPITKEVDEYSYGKINYFFLKGVETEDRMEFLEQHPELLKAYNALNDAAREKLVKIAAEQDVTDIDNWIKTTENAWGIMDAMEALLEGEFAADEPYSGMLEVVRRAKELL